MPCSGASRRAACYATGGNDNRRRSPTPRDRRRESVTAEAAALAAPAAKTERAAQLGAVAGYAWSGALLALLGLLVLYPVAMLLLGALTNTNPVVDGFGVFDLSLANFITVLGNPNVHLALANSLIACAGGTALAVIIGLAFSWIVVRTNTPWRGFVAAVRLITPFTLRFPPICPAIMSGMLLSFIVMLGIYGIPAVLGAPADIPVLTTYIFKLTNWSPPLYSTAAAVAIILMVVTGALVLLQQRV